MAPHPTTVPQQLLHRAEASPDRPGYWRETASGWESVSWSTILAHVRAISEHLIRLGLSRGERVAIMLPTSIEWEYCNLAALSAGATVIGVDAHDSDTNIRHLLSVARPSVLVVGPENESARLAGLMPSAPKFVLQVDPDPGHDCFQFLRKIISQAPPEIRDWPRAAEDDLATIVFTSGSTGAPKGIGYTHRQLCLAGKAILDRFGDVDANARIPCWMPLSNLFQRILNLCAMMRAAECYFVSSPTKIMDRLPSIRPTLLIGVPRFFEKVFAGMQAELARRPETVRAVAKWAVRTGHHYRSLQRQGIGPSVALKVRYALADRLVLQRLRSLAGPDLKFMVSGSAPMPVWLLEQLHAIGWLVLEAYGTSENVVPIAINAPRAFRFGSVGMVLPQNDIRIAEDGELLVRGTGVCTGYYGQSSDTRLLDAEGFLHTGDYARVDAEQYVWLTGRKSDVFKTSTGRRIAPAPVESCIKRLPYVDHVAVLGSNRPYPFALVALNLPALPWAVEPSQSLSLATLEEIGRDIARLCVELPEHQRPGAVLVTRTPFSIASGELTSNLKLRRATIEQKYAPEAAALYSTLSRSRTDASLPALEVSSAPIS